MPSHRHDPETEPVSLRRLTKALGGGSAGWTPSQPAVADEESNGGRGVMVAPHASALAWLVVPGGGLVGGGGGGGGDSGPVDLNSATVEQLDALPGVGPVLAQRIIAWRDAHGGFRNIDDLQQVPGIGARKFSDLKALVSA